MSELAVNSPDDGPDDGPHLLLPSPGCHPEDLKSSVGSGQRVGHRMQRLHNSPVHMQMWNRGCTCRGGDRITGLATRTNRTLSRTQTYGGGFESRSYRSCCLKRLISCIVAFLASHSALSVLAAPLSSGGRLAHSLLCVFDLGDVAHAQTRARTLYVQVAC